MTDTDTTRAGRPLADMVAEAYLRASRWAGYPVPVELEDGTAVKVVTPTAGPVDLISVEDVETGHAAEFRLSVRATQLPTLGPKDDGATRAELADAHRHAQEPRPELGNQSPADLLLAVVAAARDDHRGGCAPETCGGSRLDPCRLANALEALSRTLQAEARESGQPEPGHWHPTTWRDVKTGDRIRVGGQHEAEVEVAMEVTWLGSGAAQVPVKLKDRGHYTMPPSGPVEVWVPSLPEWAAQAYLALMEEPYVEGLSRG